MDKPIWQQLDEEFQCEHAATEIRYKLDSLGRRLYVRQCLDCGGQVGSAVPYADVPDRVAVSEFDGNIRDRWFKRRQVRQQELSAEMEAERDKESAEWFAQYNEYLKTPDWARRRQGVLDRDEGICQAGYPGCAFRATEVHHLNYRHAFDEPLFDLVAVCHRCHERLHNGNKQTA